MNPIAIEIQDVTLGYGNKKNQQSVKKNITLTGNYGELIALIGANGIGKSTLMKTVCGFIPPFSGDVFIHENQPINIRKIDLIRKAKLISFVGTRIITDSIITVYDYVALGRFPYTCRLGILTENDKAKIFEALNAVEMRDLKDKKMVAISDGEKQRAGIACALAQDTPVVILDEPTAYLDIAHKFDVVRLLRQIAHEQNKLLIYSTHDLTIALRLADKFWMMLSDECLQDAPEDLVLKGKFDKIFANYQINFSTVKGDFEFKKEIKGTVFISENTIENKWLANAFERIGFNITNDNTGNCSANYDFSTQMFQYRKDDTVKSYRTIYELIAGLNS